MTSSADVPMTLIGYSWGAWLGFLFASKYPELLSKLILVSAGVIESKYNPDLMNTRLKRLNQHDRKEAKRLFSIIQSDSSNNKVLSQFGKLMTIADSSCYCPSDVESVIVNMSTHQAIWAEATRLRNSNEFMNCASKITTPVVAIHGDYDPHPVDGVKKPLSELLPNLKMIILTNCGHTP